MVPNQISLIKDLNFVYTVPIRQKALYAFYRSYLKFVNSHIRPFLFNKPTRRVPWIDLILPWYACGVEWKNWIRNSPAISDESRNIVEGKQKRIKTRQWRAFTFKLVPFVYHSMSLHYRRRLKGGWQPVPLRFLPILHIWIKSIKRSNDRVFF